MENPQEEEGEFTTITMTMDDEGNLVTRDGTILPPDTVVYVPVGRPVPVRFEPESRGGGGITTFDGLRKHEFSDPKRAAVTDCLMRNTVRLTFWNMVHKFAVAGLEALLGKNFVFLQLVLVDPNRDIQEKMYQGLSRHKPEDPNVVQNSRQKFKELVPHLLQDTKCWVFSRSLVIKEYNKTFLNETLLKFFSHDPVGGLKDVACDIPFGTSDSEVSKVFKHLRDKALKEYKDTEPTEVPTGVRCAEVFMFIAGDFALDNDGGLNSRKSLQKFLRFLGTEDGIQKIHAFDEMTASCPNVSSEKIDALKDSHHTV